jgi:mannose/fructose/N-acetylgalactosamine-specific phosphotransferase system component IIC
VIAPALLSALAGLDRTAFAQSFFAHPLVCATTAGALAGDVQAGLWIGLSLTVFSAEHIPVGESRIRDWSSVAVAAAFAAAQRDEATQGLILACAALCALPAGHAIRGARGLILRLRNAIDDDSLARQPRLAQRIQLAGLFLHFSRGAFVGTLIFSLLDFAAARVRLEGSLAEGLGLFWQLAAVAGLPVLFRIHVWARLRGRSYVASQWERA